MLTAIIFTPVVFALLICSLKGERAIRITAMTGAVLDFVLSLVMLSSFHPHEYGLQFVEKVPWVRTVGIDYFLAIDGISLWLVMLTTLLTPLTILASWKSIGEKVKGFYVAILFLETAMLGSFLAFDAILFYVFFEASLIPMYFIVGIWGGERRIYATTKFFIYTMVGSVFMLLAIIALMYMTQQLPAGHMTSNILEFYRLKLPFIAGDFFNTQTLLFFAFAFAFAIKVPLFPFHTWLPDAHVQAPTPGSVILAGVMLKMGTYGYLRFALPIFPEASAYWSWLFLFLGVVGIIYGAMVAMVQPDIKKLVAYSSVSHMGYVIIGLFALNSLGITGGLYQMLNHGISTGALFLLVGMIYERTHSREISKYGGLATVAPLYTIIFILVTLSSIAVPLTNGFVGEFMILLGTFKAHKPYAIFAVSGVVLGATYMLWLVQRVFFGKMGEIVEHYKDKGLDINLREFCVLAPLVVLIFWMGVFPQTFLNYSKASIDHLVTHRVEYFLPLPSDQKGESLNGQYKVPEKKKDSGVE